MIYRSFIIIFFFCASYLDEGICIFFLTEEIADQFFVVGFYHINIIDHDLLETVVSLIVDLKKN